MIKHKTIHLQHEQHFAKIFKIKYVGFFSIDCVLQELLTTVHNAFQGLLFCNMHKKIVNKHTKLHSYVFYYLLKCLDSCAQYSVHDASHEKQNWSMQSLTLKYPGGGPGNHTLLLMQKKISNQPHHFLVNWGLQEKCLAHKIPQE